MTRNTIMNYTVVEHLAWIIPLTFFLLLYLIFRKRIHLILIWLFYGDYSRKYVATYREYFYKNPLPQCIKDDFINHIIAFFKFSNEASKHRTINKIEYLGFRFGSSLKDLLKRGRKPDYLNVIDDFGHEIKIIGFSEDLFESDVRELYYFIDGTFFMGEFYFPEIRKIKPSIICQSLADKYELSDLKDGNDFFINDDQGTILQYKNTGFSIMIRYFNMTDEGVQTSLQDCVDPFSSISVKRKSSETIENWKNYL
jgi:hypothetical protein